MSDNKIDQTINKGLQSAKDALAEKMMHLAHKEAAQTTQVMVYNIIFTGTFTKDEKLVVAAMAKFFKQGQEATKRLLKPGRVIKSFPDKGPADKLAKMLNGIGLSCKVEMEAAGGEDKREAGSLLEKAAFKIADSKTPEVRIPKLSQIGWKAWLVAGVVLSAALGAGVALWLKPPVVSGDSFASYKTSVQKVVDYAPPEKKAAIQKAVDTLTGAGSAYHDENTFGGTELVAAGVVYSRVDGLTGDEIIAAAEKDLEDTRAGFHQEIENIKQEIAKEEATIAELEKSNQTLRQLIISEAKFTWTRETPEMMVRLTNGSDETISKILFQGELYDASGKLLASEPLSFGTAAGIPPGAYKFAVFTPSKDSPWSTEATRQNWQTSKFVVTVQNAINIKGVDVGVDLRPNRQRIADHQKRIKRFEKELEKLKL
jgi:hypothetical protein